MLDVVFVVTVLAVFAVVALIAKGVEKLGPRPEGSAHRDPTSRGGRA